MANPKYINKSHPMPKLSQYTYEGESINFDFYKEHMDEVGQEKTPLEFEYFCRTVSPIIAFSIHFCKPECYPQLIKSLFAVGRFNELAPNAREEFTSIDDWNQGKFEFSVRRFGYIPKKPDHTLFEAAQVYFSPSKVTMCFGIKAEFMIAAYWKFRDDPYWGPIVRSIITYAVDMYESHPGSEEYKGARYLFELAFAYNFFVKIHNERKLGIPYASTSNDTYRYNGIQEFGVFRINEGTTCQPDDPGYRMYATPRTITDIPFAPNTWFYIAYDSPVGDRSTQCAKKWIPSALRRMDMNYFLSDLAMMYEYTSEFLATGPVEQPQYETFESREEAQAFVDGLEGIDKFNNPNIYYCLKVAIGENVYRALVFKRSSKEEPSKEETKKEESSKEEPSKEEAKKEAKKEEPSKEEVKKEEPSKEEPKFKDEDFPKLVTKIIPRQPKKFVTEYKPTNSFLYKKPLETVYTPNKNTFVSTYTPKREVVLDTYIPKKEEPSKEEPKKETKKEEPKKEDKKETKKEEPKKEDKKETKKEEPKKEDKKEEPSKEEVKKEVKKEDKKETKKEEPKKEDTKKETNKKDKKEVKKEEPKKEVKKEEPKKETKKETKKEEPKKEEPKKIEPNKQKGKRAISDWDPSWD